MSDEQKKFRVLQSETGGFNVKETTGAVYKNVKLAILYFNGTDVNSRISILREFAMCSSEPADQKEKLLEIKKKEYGVEIYYEKLAGTLLIDPEGKLKDAKFKDLLLNEVNAASDYFFSFLK